MHRFKDRESRAGVSRPGACKVLDVLPHLAVFRRLQDFGNRCEPRSFITCEPHRARSGPDDMLMSMTPIREPFSILSGCGKRSKPTIRSTRKTFAFRAAKKYRKAGENWAVSTQTTSRSGRARLDDRGEMFEKQPSGPLPAFVSRATRVNFRRGREPDPDFTNFRPNRLRARAEMQPRCSTKTAENCPLVNFLRKRSRLEQKSGFVAPY